MQPINMRHIGPIHGWIAAANLMHRLNISYNRIAFMLSHVKGTYMFCSDRTQDNYEHFLMRICVVIQFNIIIMSIITGLFSDFVRFIKSYLCIIVLGYDKDKTLLTIMFQSLHYSFFV